MCVQNLLIHHAPVSSPVSQNRDGVCGVCFVSFVEISNIVACDTEGWKYKANCLLPYVSNNVIYR